MLLIGIDEAGYGPKLGPLCQGYTALRCPDPDAGFAPDLWKLLRPVVSRHPARPGRIAIDDSKRIHTATRGLELLAHGVTAFLECGGEALAPESIEIPHAALYARLLPESDRLALEEDVFARAAASSESIVIGAPGAALPAGVLERWRPVLKKPSLPEVLAQRNVQLVALGARAMSARHYNSALARSGNKADVNWSVIGAQLKRLVSLAGADEPVFAVIDRQGGRKFYGARLTDLFEGAFSWPECELPHESIYRIERGAGLTRVAFAVDGDAHSLPVALASMAAKLVREICMARLNQFFVQHDEALKPTAGYYNDANRFLRESAALRLRLGIDDSVLIRIK